MPSKRVLLFAAVCLALAAVIAVVAVTLSGAPREARTQGTADVGGAFQMVDQNGRAVDQSLLEGKWSLVFFGFTYCPDYCPMTLQTLAAAQDRLGTRAEDVQIVFISVDSQRDTPEQLKAYLESPGFPEGVIGLTGTEQQVDATVKAYRAHYAKVGEDDDYTMDHSLYVYLMNPEGEFVRVLAHGLGPDQIAEMVARDMREAA